jgi:hypothetical protein
MNVSWIRTWMVKAPPNGNTIAESEVEKKELLPIHGNILTDLNQY